jgi:hypothetical protein
VKSEQASKVMMRMPTRLRKYPGGSNRYVRSEVAVAHGGGSGGSRTGVIGGNAIERATQLARRLLDEEFSSQLEGTFDVLRSGAIASKGGEHLSARQVCQRDKIVAAIEHKRAAGMTAVEAVTEALSR